MTIAIDRHVASQLPADQITVVAIRDALVAWETARQTYRQASQDMTQLEHERPLAVERDREVLADALEAGKGDPGQKHTEAHDAKIAEASRRADALRLIEERRFQDLGAAFAEHGDELARSTDANLGVARTEFTDALDRLAECHAALVVALASNGFATSGRYKPGGHANATRCAGHEVSVDQVFAALQALVPERARELALVDAA